MKGANWTPITILGGPYVVLQRKHVFDMIFNKYRKPFKDRSSGALAPPR